MKNYVSKVFYSISMSEYQLLKVKYSKRADFFSISSLMQTLVGHACMVFDQLVESILI